MTTSSSSRAIRRACVMLVGTTILAAPAAALAQPVPHGGPNVRVVNTPDRPVPVALGAPVEILTTAPLPVALNGPVSIDTTVPLPVSVVGAGAPQPIQIALFQPSANSPDINRFRVPAGKRLVIEDVSCSAVDADDFLLGLGVRTRVNGVETVHLCPFDVRVNTGRPGTAMSYAGARSVRAYADPGTDVVVAFVGVPPATFPIFSAALSGHLVDVP